jgi:hypothetical protein
LLNNQLENIYNEAAVDKPSYHYSGFLKLVRKSQNVSATVFNEPFHILKEQFPEHQA